MACGVWTGGMPATPPNPPPVPKKAAADGAVEAATEGVPVATWAPVAGGLLATDVMGALGMIRAEKGAKASTQRSTGFAKQRNLVKSSLCSPPPLSVLQKMRSS